MASRSDKSVKHVIEYNAGIGMRVFESVVGAIAVGGIYLVLVSSLPMDLGRMLAVLVGVAVADACIILKKRKYMPYIALGVVAVYTVMCVAIGFGAFAGGAVDFWNDIASEANANMHWGFPSVYGVNKSGASGFLFGSALAAWLGLGMALLCHKSNRLFALVCGAITLLWLCLGLVPKPYAIILLVAACLCLMMSSRGFTVKSAWCYSAVVVAIVGLISPCFLYAGSEAVTAFGDGIVRGTERLVYGEDSLPEGRLQYSSGMRSSDAVRLEADLPANVRNLYLRGFVGGDFAGTEWRATDKNIYVSDGYQGILEYVGAGGIPTVQYASYSALCGVTDKYSVNVKNVSANRKYVYAPYSMFDYSSGSPDHDMSLRGNIFTSRNYSFTVFDGDKSSESVQQASWLSSPSERTPAMSMYVAYEEQYRGFVHSAYTKIDEYTKTIVENAVATRGTEEKINPATHLIRNYFLENFTYGDIPDFSDDFVIDFFGGKIKKANSAYFATAATLAFRMYGYAARYAEGYLIYSEEGETHVAVTGDNAHAWTEVYFDGIGWLPIEVTPGFFAEQSAVDPDRPNDVPDEPVKPPENPDKPDVPDVPIKPPDEPKAPLTHEEKKLLATLKILVPISAATLAAMTVVLAFALNRYVRLEKKRKKLNCNGESFGRAAHGIMERDCACIGGFDADKLAAFGVDKEATVRFDSLVERCVYGGYDLSENERKYVLNYIRTATDAVIASGNTAEKFVYKYIKVLGL